MRRLWLGIAIGLLPLFLAGPAMAKTWLEPVEARITGPGLEDPLLLRDPDGYQGTGQTPLGLFAGQALDYTYDDTDTARTPPAPRGGLGPRYTIQWRFKSMRDGVRDGERTLTLHQYLFPYAEGGPVLHLPDGPRADRGSLDTGWTIATPALRTNLRAWGLPGRAELGEETSPASQERGASIVPLFALGVGTVVVAAGAWLLTRRRNAPAAHAAP